MQLYTTFKHTSSFNTLGSSALIVSTYLITTHSSPCNFVLRANKFTIFKYFVG